MPKRNIKRNRQVVAFRDGGATFKEIAKRFGITASRARQIVVKSNRLEKTEARGAIRVKFINAD